MRALLRFLRAVLRFALLVVCEIAYGVHVVAGRLACALTPPKVSPKKGR